MSRDAVTDAVIAMLDESDSWGLFAVELGRELGWSMEPTECLRRVRQYRNRQTYRHMPTAAVGVAIRVSCLDYVTPILQRELIRAEDAQPEKPGVRGVRSASSRALREVG